MESRSDYVAQTFLNLFTQPLPESIQQLWLLINELLQIVMKCYSNLKYMILWKFSWLGQERYICALCVLRVPHHCIITVVKYS